MAKAPVTHRRRDLPVGGSSEPAADAAQETTPWMNERIESPSAESSPPGVSIRSPRAGSARAARGDAKEGRRGSY